MSRFRGGQRGTLSLCNNSCTCWRLLTALRALPAACYTAWALPAASPRLSLVTQPRPPFPTTERPRASWRGIEGVSGFAYYSACRSADLSPLQQPTRPLPPRPLRFHSVMSHTRRRPPSTAHALYLRSLLCELSSSAALFFFSPLDSPSLPLLPCLPSFPTFASLQLLQHLLLLSRRQHRQRTTSLPTADPPTFRLLGGRERLKASHLRRVILSTSCSLDAVVGCGARRACQGDRDEDGEVDFPLPTPRLDREGEGNQPWD